MSAAGTTALRMPRATLEGLADATGTPLPWRAPVRPARPAPVPGLLADALTVFGTAEVLVEVTTALRLPQRPGQVVQLTSWQRLRGDRVTTVSATSPATVELAWFGADRWPRELARAVAVDPPGAPAPGAPGDADVRLDALLTGRAGAGLRHPAGRLLATVAGRRGVGWVGALLLADGWRALTPYADRGVPSVHVRRVRPERLAACLTALALGARP